MGHPWKTWATFSVAFFTLFADIRVAAPIGTI